MVRSLDVMELPRMVRRIATGPLAAASLAALLGGACWDFDGPDAGPEEKGGAIEGRILVQAGQLVQDRAAIERARAQVSLAGARTGDGARFTPAGRPSTARDRAKLEWRAGEALVLFERGRFDKQQLGGALRAMLQDAGVRGVDAKPALCTARRFCRVDLLRDGAPLSLDETTDVVQALHAHRVDGVRVVARNFVKRGFRVPNDPFYFYQWHYEAVNLPAAWDISTGSDDVVVAVIDSGLVISHPDVIDRTVPGVDVIEDPGVAADGNGRDTDPTDPGDNLFGDGQHSFHGTHVAGTIGAETDNAEGVAGTMWAGKVLPVRVLGQALSGSDSDILSGLFWAVGEPDVEQLPQNLNPAKVINLSLGGETDPQGTDIWQEVITAITADEEGAYGKPIIVCAAGNTDQDASVIVPANLDNIITVGATRVDGTRAPYSNRGDVIDLMAPGGDEAVDLNADGYGDGVLSLYGNEYNFEQGTSMSSPHVAGVVGLLVSLVPDLDQATAELILMESADATSQCNEGCGAGLLDAAAALLAAGGSISPDPRLAVDQSQVYFGEGIASVQVTLLNLGNAALDFTASIAGAQAQLFSVSPTSGTVPATGTLPLTITLARADFGAGNANLELLGTGAAAGQAALVNLAFDDGSIAPPPTMQTVEVGAYERREAGLVRVKSAIAARDDGFTYKIEGLPPGSYEVYAVGDEDNDGVYDAQREPFGGYPLASAPKVLEVVAEETISGIDFSLASGFVVDNVGGVGAPCAVNADCTFAPDAECITDWQGGYCSRICGADGFCGANASCENLTCVGGEPCAVCLSACVTVSQCRGGDGFVCDAFDTCTPLDFN
jgi:serine protease